MERFPAESENAPHDAPEESGEEVFRSYVEDLELQPEDFKKKILDVGSGTGQFAKWAKEHGVSSEIVSVEPYKELLEKQKGIRGDAIALPFRDGSFELVISNGAMPHVFRGEVPSESVAEKVRARLEEMLRVTAAGGEIRLGCVPKGDIYENQRLFARALDDALHELGAEHNLAIEHIRKEPDTYEYDESGTTPQRILARRYLIKIKKPYAEGKHG